MRHVIVVKSIDYDVNLDFLLEFPEPSNMSSTSTTHVDSESDASLSLQQNGSLQQSVTPPSNSDLDCLITPERTKLSARPVKVPSIDRSTKPSSVSMFSSNTVPETKSSLVSNAASDAAVNGSQPTTNVVAHINNKPTMDGNINQLNNATDTRSGTSNRATVDATPRSSFVPPAPDRSTKPAVISSSSDVNVHSAQLEREQVELSRLQMKKMQEASDLANLMREKRRLEEEMERKRQQLAASDADSSTQLVLSMCAVILSVSPAAWAICFADVYSFSVIVSNGPPWRKLCQIVLHQSSPNFYSK